jgi:DNA-directed RNA polymerase specialized sigma24 family protein
MKKIRKNYVNNPDFCTALVEYQAALQRHKDERRNSEPPVVPPYIGECIYQISKRLSTKPQFSGYSFRDDMIMDGVENCLRYMHNFDAEKTQNPFAYFTQIIWNAFLRRIAKEKKQLYIVYKNSQELIHNGGTYSGGEDLSMHLTTGADYIDSFIEDFEKKNLTKVKKDDTSDN